MLQKIVSYAHEGPLKDILYFEAEKIFQSPEGKKLLALEIIKSVQIDVQNDIALLGFGLHPEVESWESATRMNFVCWLAKQVQKITRKYVIQLEFPNIAPEISTGSNLCWWVGLVSWDYQTKHKDSSGYTDEINKKLKLKMNGLQTGGTLPEEVLAALDMGSRFERTDNGQRVLKQALEAAAQ